MKPLELIRGNVLFKENDVVYRYLDEIKIANSPQEGIEFNNYNKESTISSSRRRLLMYKNANTNRILVPCGHLYFVIEGEFEVCKTITVFKNDTNGKIDFKGNFWIILGLTIDDKMKADLEDDYHILKELESKGEQESV
jgi:hypothetical protein